MSSLSFEQHDILANIVSGSDCEATGWLRFAYWSGQTALIAERLPNGNLLVRYDQVALTISASGNVDRFKVENRDVPVDPHPGAPIRAQRNLR